MSRYEKRMAEDAIESLAGVKEVHNHLRLQHLSQGITNQSDQSGQSRQGGQPGVGAQNQQPRERSVGGKSSAGA